MPIIFHKKYDIGLWGLERLHPFDTKKYGKIAQYLKQKCKIEFFEPSKISNQELLLVHTPEYLYSLKYSRTISGITEIYLVTFIPNFLLQKYILDPMRYATAGTVLGAELAVKYGWAINLGGGYHHAKSDIGGGFCFFADIPLAVKLIRKKYKDLKVLIVDLDAHQGNGSATILKDDKLTAILDIYVEDNYPKDYQAREYITFNYPVKAYISDTEYLELLQKKLPKALDHTKPDLIIYNAGTDVFERDPLAGLL